MKISDIFKKYRGWLALAALVLLAGFAAKWAAYDGVSPQVGRARWVKVSDDYALESEPLASGGAVTQTLSVEPGERLFGVRFKHTSGGEQSSGTLRVALYSEGGEPLREVSLDAASLKEDHFVEALFDAPVESVEYTARYSLKISLEGASPYDPLRVWLAHGQAAGFRCEQGGSECGTMVLQLADDRVSEGLVSGFWAIAIFLIAGLAAAYWLLFIRKVKLHIAFAVAASVLGVAFAFVIPQLGAPDEDVHYVTAYEYASELLSQPTKDSDGALLMRACDAPRLDENGRIKREYDVFAYERVYDSLTSSAAPDARMEPVKARSAYTIFRLLYLPQTLGIALARLAGAGGAATQLMGRLFNLAFYVALSAFAVKKAPFGRAAFAAVALLPMSLQIGASMCYDALVLGMCFAFISLCLSCALAEGRPKWYELAALGALAVLIAPSKGIYLPLAALLLLAAPKLFKNAKKGFVAMLVLIAAAGAVWFAVNGSSILFEITGARSEALELTNEQLAETFPNGDARQEYTIGYILARPDEAAELVVRTAQHSLPLYIQGVVGGILGEIILGGVSINWTLTIALVIILLLSCVGARGEEGRLRGWPKALCVAVALAVAALAVLICMTWTPINYKTIYGLQGRYLLPVRPLLLLALRPRGLAFERDPGRGLMLAQCAVVFLVLLDAATKIAAA